MADVNLANLARMTVASSGTGTITLSGAVSGYLTFDLAGCSTAAAGTIVRYAVNDTTQSELAYGTYTSSALTLTRGSSTGGMKSTNSNSPINMSNAAQVFISPAEADFPFKTSTTGTTATSSLAIAITNRTTGGSLTFDGAAAEQYQILANTIGEFSIRRVVGGVTAFQIDGSGNTNIIGSFSINTTTFTVNGTTGDTAVTGLLNISSSDAGQIQFPATQNASAGANTLDDYEEGTFTPTLAFGGASVGMTFTTQTGSYTKIGNRVIVDVQLALSAKGSSTGSAVITLTGLPSASPTTACSIQAANGAATMQGVQARVVAATNTVGLQRLAAGTATDLADTDFADTTAIRVSAVYVV